MPVIPILYNNPNNNVIVQKLKDSREFHIKLIEIVRYNTYDFCENTEAV